MAVKKSKQEAAKRLSSGSNIRFEEATSQRKRHAGLAITQEIIPVGNFLGFLKEHAVVGLIIGFVLGNEVQTLVKQIIQSFIDPLTKLLFGTALSQKAFVLHLHNRSASFSWGATVYAFIIFIFVVFALYLAVRVLRLEDNKETDAAKR
jgi:large-conductance mechanosensitive channel